MTTLDVGSGANPHGDVNLDMYTGYSPHAEMNVKKPTIRADAHYLPFQNEMFIGVHCSHTLEHLTKPEVALREMLRVLQKYGRATFEVPDSNNKPASTQLKYHIHFWAMDSFTRLICAAGFQVDLAECTGENNLRVKTRKTR